MAFKMRSGNKVSFKNMGSSPAKDMKTGKYEHSFESPAKQKKEKTYPEGYTEKDIKFLKEQREDVVRYEDLDKKGQEIWKSQGKPVPKNRPDDAKGISDSEDPGKSPTKQKSETWPPERTPKRKVTKGEKMRDKKTIKKVKSIFDDKKIKDKQGRDMTDPNYKWGGESPNKQYDYSKSVWKNIKSQGKKDKVSNKVKRDASILAGDTGDIISNQELKQQSKTRKQKQRSVDSEGGRRRTKSERIKAKDTKLSEKLSQAEAMEARGEGKRGFSWKNAGMAVLEGQGLMGAARSGMGSGDYTSTRIKAKQAKRAGKATRKEIKAQQRQARLDKIKKASDLNVEKGSELV